MLTGLAIRDIVLIQKLDLSFAPGLTALTGETGAGKSIILDALGLALGGRADRGLVRAGADQGSVTAAFDIEPSLQERLADDGIEAEGELILRRVVTADGRSRAFANDVPVSVTLLRDLGDRLLEVHGQMDQRGLLDTRLHRGLLDAFGGLQTQTANVAAAHAAWQQARQLLEALEAQVEAARREEDYLRHRAAELDDLAPEVGEEEQLAVRRQQLGNREKLANVLSEALSGLVGSGGAVERLGSAARRLERSAALAPEILEPVAAALQRALVEADEGESAIRTALRSIDDEGDSLEKVEERLFALRDAARKHRVPVDELPRLRDETLEMLQRLDAGLGDVEAAGKAVGEARRQFEVAARELSEARTEAAGRMAKAVMKELPPLRLERARFQVGLEPLPEQAWTAEGAERVQFEVMTNPGQPFGPLARIASGGELSRFMLALKVVLARLDDAGTLIFDEVDAGIGGATADAVGERLARLGRERQVLVVTHAAQVAARADHHLNVSKRVVGDTTRVEVKPLDAAQRRDEVARMLAGAEVTDAARAAAQSLIAVGSGR